MTVIAVALLLASVGLACTALVHLLVLDRRARRRAART